MGERGSKKRSVVVYLTAVRRAIGIGSASGRWCVCGLFEGFYLASAASGKCESINFISASFSSVLSLRSELDYTFTVHGVLLKL
jgi:hypothetical protein